MRISNIIKPIIIVLYGMILSCTRETIKVNFEYPTTKINNTTISDYKKDTVCFYFDGWFNPNSVIVKLNGKKIYERTFSDDNYYFGYIEFEKQKDNVIQIQIKGKNTSQFKLDDRYNFAVINWNKEKSQIDFFYKNEQPMFD